MAKIKGWRKDGDKPTWFGRTRYRTVRVIHSGPSNLGEYHFEVRGMSEPGEVNYRGLEYRRYFDTKQEAFSAAVGFMRRHPNG